MDDRTKSMLNREARRHQDATVKALKQIQDRIVYALSAVESGRNSGLVAEIFGAATEAHVREAQMTAAKAVLELIPDGEGK